MSTNYYWIPGPTDALKAFGHIHIGKSAGGWSFMFKGYRFCQDEPVTADVGQGLSLVVDVVHLTLIATTWAQWKALLSRSGRIEDEYGRTVPFEEFAEMVEVTLAPGAMWGDHPLKNHVTELRTDPRYRGQAQFHDEEQYWLDPAGYSFGIGEFS